MENSGLLYTGRPGHIGIFTVKGDFIGTVEDDILRGKIIALLNDTYKLENEDMSDDLLELAELCESKGIDTNRLEELSQIGVKHAANAERFADIKRAASDLLGEELSDHEVDLVNFMIQELEKVDVPKSADKEPMAKTPSPYPKKFSHPDQKKVIAREIHITITTDGEIRIK